VNAIQYSVDKLKNVMLSAAVAAASVLAASNTSAIAAECSGYGIFVVESAETEDLGGGHQLILVRMSSVAITDDPNHILNQTTGECHASIVKTPDGMRKISSHCGRQDSDGDTYSLEFSLAPGAEKGEWKTYAGTGKFSEFSASGWSHGTKPLRGNLERVVMGAPG
jgi:hypothetical protein